MSKKSNKKIEGETPEIDETQDVVEEVVTETQPVVEEEPKKVETKKLNTIASDLMGDAPEVQEHAVNAFKDKQQAKVDGAKFNPEIHAVKADGSPSLTKTGKFRMKTKKAKLNNPKETRLKQAETQQTAEDIRTMSHATATTIQSVKGQVYNAMLGYKQDAKDEAICTALTTDYLVSKGGVQMSPLAMLAVMETKILIGALNTEKGVTVKTNMKAKMASWWVKFREKKKDKENGAQPVRGTNNVGENDTSNKERDGKEASDG